jgi:hypothetical protein
MCRKAIAILAAGCAAAVSRPPPPQPSPDPEIARASVETILSDSLLALERGVIDASAVAPDAFSWGVAARDVFTSREALARSAPPEKFTAQGLERRVFVAPDGRSAWFWEFYTQAGRVVRHTGLAGEAGGKWMILAQHASFAWPDAEVEKRQGLGPVPQLAPVGDGVAPGAEEVAALFREAIFFPRMLAAATGPDFIIIGTDTAKPPAASAPADIPTPKDGVRAGLGPGGSTAWAAANPAWGPWDREPPMRFMYVFLKEGGRWRLVQNHHSYALE